MSRDVLAGGVIAVGAVDVLPVGWAVYAGSTLLAGGAILSGAKRWNAGQSELEVVGDTVVANPVRVPAITWTEGAIGSAYAGTTRIVAMMASGPGNNANLVGSAAQTELRDVGTLQGKTRAEIENMLQQRGYTAVPNRANDGGNVWTKSFADGSTAAVRIDPGNINLPQGYAGRVAHAHKEIVPSAKVVNGNYRPRYATTLDDLGNPSTIHNPTHIPIVW